jgi:WD40 repeat protein
MDELTWKKLTRRFPRTPAKLRMDICSERAHRWKPIQVTDRPVIALAFSADGRSLSAAGGGLIPGATAIRVIDVETRMVRRVCHGHVMGVFDLAFDPRTGLLASASHDYSVLLWEVDERNDAIYLVGDPDAGVSRNRVAFSGTEVVVGDGMTFLGAGAWLHAVDLETGKTSVILTIDEEGRLGVDEMVVLPGGETIVVALDDMRDSSGIQQICAVREHGLRRTRWDPGGRLHAMRALASDRFVAAMETPSESDDEEPIPELVVFEAVTGTRLVSRPIPDASYPPIAVAPDCRQLVVGLENRLEIFDAETLEPRSAIDLGDGAALSLAWSSNGVIAVGSYQTIRLFAAATGVERLD